MSFMSIPPYVSLCGNNLFLCNVTSAVTFVTFEQLKMLTVVLRHLNICDSVRNRHVSFLHIAYFPGMASWPFLSVSGISVQRGSTQSQAIPLFHILLFVTHVTHDTKITITNICTLIVGDFMFSAPTKPTITRFRPPLVKSVHNCQRFHVFSTWSSDEQLTTWEILQKNLWLEPSLVAGTGS